ncbi:MAG: leucine-rich repeat protein, partial [Bacteroidales bacterium]|nr:leucine-rich repeat protein [Bacteroidales bacterium]
MLYNVKELDCDYNIVIEKDCFVSTHELLTAKASDEEIANGIRDEYGVIYSRDGLHLLKRGHNSYSHYQIKQGCQIIRDWAFPFYEGSSISIPSSVTHIGSHAFVGCKKLTKINIPFSVVHIGERAFNHTKITSVI